MVVPDWGWGERDPDDINKHNCLRIANDRGFSFKRNSVMRRWESETR